MKCKFCGGKIECLLADEFYELWQCAECEACLIRYVEIVNDEKWFLPE